MILKIKNMESRRCKTLVRDEMDKLGLRNVTVELGEVEFEGDISDKKLQLFDSALKNMGLEILVNKRSYNSLAKTFSEKEKITIERYIITQRIERVKELLIYSDTILSDIAFKMHFSSVAHLSNQFKKITGLTPSFFRKNKMPGTNIKEIE